jgi:hypothetical protein
VRFANGQTFEVKTIVRSHAGGRAPSTPERRRDFRVVELFNFDNGRWPERGDGEAWEALVRLRDANLRHQVREPAQPWEPDRGRWRRWTAALALGRSARESASPQVPPRARPRGTTGRRVDASRAGQSRDGPPRPEDEDPDRVAGRRL